MYDYTEQVTVLNNFDVLVEFNTEQEDKDVGIMYEHVTDYRLCSVKTGKPFSANVHNKLQQLGEIDDLICYLDCVVLPEYL